MIVDIWIIVEVLECVVVDVVDRYVCFEWEERVCVLMVYYEWVWREWDFDVW